MGLPGPNLPWLKKSTLLSELLFGNIISAALLGQPLNISARPAGLVGRNTAASPQSTCSRKDKLSNAIDSRSILITSVEDHERIGFAEEVFLVQLVGAELQSGAVLQGHIKRCRSVWEVDTVSGGWRGNDVLAPFLPISSLLIFKSWTGGEGDVHYIKR